MFSMFLISENNFDFGGIKNTTMKNFEMILWFKEYIFVFTWLLCHMTFESQ